MKYMLIMRATDEAYAGFANVDFEQILETMGRFNDEMISAGVLVAAEGLDDAARGRRRRLLVAAAGRHRRAVRRDQGAVRRLLDPRRRLEGGGGRVGQAGADGRSRDEDRDPPGHQHRRVPAGQRVDPEGTGVAGGHRAAVSAGPGAPSVRCGGSSRPGSSAALARYTGDFALAEDVAQEALAEALVTLAPRRRAPQTRRRGC